MVKAEATAQDYANLTEKIAVALGKMTVKGSHNASRITLDKFPWILDPTTKKVLILSSHRYLTVSPRPILAVKSPVVGESTTPGGSNLRPSAIEDAASQYLGATAWRDSAGLMIRGVADDVSGIYLRDIARGLAGQYKADFLEFDINRIHREQASLLQLSAQERGLAVYKYSRKRIDTKDFAAEAAGAPLASGKPPFGGSGPAPNVQATKGAKGSQTGGEGHSAQAATGVNSAPQAPQAAPQPSEGSAPRNSNSSGVTENRSTLDSIAGVLQSLDNSTPRANFLMASAQTGNLAERFSAKLESFLKSPRGGGGSGGPPGKSPPGAGSGSGGGSPSGSGGSPPNSINQHRNNLFKLGKTVGDLSRGALWHLLIDSIFEMAARDPHQTPRVVYLRRAHLLTPPMLEYLRKKRHQYIANGIPILFVGSSIEPAASREDDSMETVLRDIRSSVTRPPPTRGVLNAQEDDDGPDSTSQSRDEDEDEDDVEDEDEEAFLADPDAFDAKVKQRSSNLIIIPPRGRTAYKLEARRRSLINTFSPHLLVSSPPANTHLREQWTTQLQEQLKASTAQANLLRILDAFRFAGLKLQISPPASSSPAASEAAAVAAAASSTTAPEPEPVVEAKLGLVPYARKLSLLLLGDLTPSTGRQSTVTPICSAGAAVFLTGQRLSSITARNIMEVAVGCARQVGASSVSLSQLSDALELVRIAGVDALPSEHSGHERLEAISSELNEAERELKSSVVHPNSITTTFDDIGALDIAKSELESLFTPFRLSRVFRGGNPLLKVPSGVLLYGPPGTGKTMLARAIAKQAGATFIHISPSNINSKWFGSAERNVAAVFSLAHKLSPAIVFIDEIDSFLSSRSAGDHEATSRVKTEFMSNWDGLKNNNEMSRSIIVMGATNRPFDLDLAVLRRLPHRILIDLPDTDARKQILIKVLRQVTLDASTLPAAALAGPLPQDEDARKTLFIEHLAKRTEGYSGSDTHNLCTTAANMIIRDILADKDYKANAAIEVIEEIARRHIHRPLSWNDFEKAFDQVKPSVDDQDRSITMLRTWQKSFGLGKKTSIGF